MAEYIERERAIAAFDDPSVERNYGDVDPDSVIRIIKYIPAADVPPTLWTDKPISGTAFMTHNQGQSGFEIHFRTDDKAKYEAVQDECRRQIGHAKPAADVRPVARGKWLTGNDNPRTYGRIRAMCGRCGAFALAEMVNAGSYKEQLSNFCPNCGADMREES